jgi:hypothetical protein
MIPIEELKVGTVYKLNSRNLSVGVFTKNKGFIGIRLKFGNRFLFEEYEYSTSVHYGTATAIEELGEIPSNIKIAESLYDECGICRKPVNFDEKRPKGRRRFSHM